MIDCSKTANYFSEKQRMTKAPKYGACVIRCTDCPLHWQNNGTNMPCGCLEMNCFDTAIKIVQRWSDNHPEKTYLTQFLGNYPNAELGEDGTPKRVCPHDIGLSDIESCAPGERHCTECWNQIID